MAYEVGDWQVATLTVAPADGTTVATLAVVAPDGTTTAPAVTGSGGGATWTAAGYELVAAGEWVERWTVTGTGKSVERRVLLVAPDPTTVPSGVRVYATTTDYANHLQAAPPSGSRRALVAASRVVDEMLVTAIYDVDINGLPTDAAHILALRDAACMQAEHQRGRGDPYNGGVPGGGISGFSIGSIQVTRGTPAGQQPDPPLPAYWSPQAYKRLSQAGLTGHPPWGY